MSEEKKTKSSPKEVAVGTLIRLGDKASKVAFRARGFGPEIDGYLAAINANVKLAIAAIQNLPDESKPKRTPAGRVLAADAVYKVAEGRREYYRRILGAQEPDAADFCAYVEDLDPRTALCTFAVGNEGKRVAVLKRDLLGELIAG